MSDRKLFSVSVVQTFTVEAVDRDYAIEAVRHYRAGIAYVAGLPIEDRIVRIVGSSSVSFTVKQKGESS